MATNDVLTRLENVLKKSFTLGEKAVKISAIIKQECEQIIATKLKKANTISQTPLLYLCPFSSLQFPQSQEKRWQNYYPVR